MPKRIWESFGNLKRKFQLDIQIIQILAFRNSHILLKHRRFPLLASPDLSGGFAASGFQTLNSQKHNCFCFESKVGEKQFSKAATKSYRCQASEQ